MNKDLLFEIGTEELPASFIQPALNALEKGVKSGLEKAGLGVGKGGISLQTFGTPRRLTLIATGVPETTPKQKVTVTGPPARAGFDKDGNPTKAALGFARGKGLDASALKIITTKKGDYVGAEIETGGEAVAPFLVQLLSDLSKNIPFKKSMRWTGGDVRFARPVRWIVALFGEAILPVELAGIKAGNVSRGLRFFGKKTFTVSGVSDYLAQLKVGGVVLDGEKRKAIIRKGLKEAAAEIGGVPELDEALLDDVANLVEHPRVVLGRFDEAYLKLPVEVPVTVMKHHQRYFPVLDNDGALMNAFLQVTNSPTADVDTVILGNQRVLSARLSDGQFFWKEDLKAPLDSYVSQLDGIVFHARLGTLGEKVSRMESLAVAIAEGAGLDASVQGNVQRTAHLAKADLVTWMVGEFPELQGRMGMYYAQEAGENDAVAQGIVEHYLPKVAGGTLPKGDVGTVVALADKMDSVVVFHAIGKGPTGAADPYALRRAGLGILRILMDKGWNIPLTTMVDAALKSVDAIVFSRAKTTPEAVQKQVLAFFETRLKGLLQGEGMPRDQVEAVLAAGSDLVAEAVARARAFHRMAQSEDFRGLMIAFKRAVNISRGQADGGETATTRLLGEGAALREAVFAVEKDLENLVADKSFDEALGKLLSLKAPIDAFFDNVMVMDDDLQIREARLAILHRVAALFRNIADFGRLS